MGAIYEMCQASGLGAVVYADKIPVLPVTLRVAEFCKIDPLRLISSGCLVVTAPDGEALCKAYREAGVNAKVVGKIVREAREVVRSGNTFALSSPGPDHLWQARRYLESITRRQ